MLRKTIAGLAIVAAALVANPFNHADAADGRSAAVRKCVNQGKAARTAAQRNFRVAIRDARELEPAARAAAVQAAQDAFRQAAQTANADFRACMEAIEAD